MTKIEITKDAVLKRYRRRLAKQGYRLQKRLKTDTSHQCDYYVVDNHLNGIIGFVHDLETTAREAGILGIGEVIV